MRIHHTRLRGKGWSDEEIWRVEAAIGRADAAKHPAYSFLERAVFWGLLFLTVVAVFTVSLVFIPLLLVLPTGVIVPLLLLLGLCFGAFFALLIPDIEWVERRHHALNLVILAGIAVLNIAFIVIRVNKLESALNFGVQHNPWVLAIVFAAALIAPYLVHLYRESRARSAARAARPKVEEIIEPAPRVLSVGEQVLRQARERQH